MKARISITNCLLTVLLFSACGEFKGTSSGFLKQASVDTMDVRTNKWGCYVAIKEGGIFKYAGNFFIDVDDRDKCRELLNEGFERTCSRIGGSRFTRIYTLNNVYFRDGREVSSTFVEAFEDVSACPGFEEVTPSPVQPGTPETTPPPTNSIVVPPPGAIFIPPFPLPLPPPVPAPSSGCGVQDGENRSEESTWYRPVDGYARAESCPAGQTGERLAIFNRSLPVVCRNGAVQNNGGVEEAFSRYDDSRCAAAAAPSSGGVTVCITYGGQPVSGVYIGSFTTGSDGCASAKLSFGVYEFTIAYGDFRDRGSINHQRDGDYFPFSY